MLAPCSGCGRHVRVDASNCPFCGTAIRDVAAPSFVSASLLIGLALFGCGEKDDDDDNGATVSATATMSDTSSDGGDTTTGDIDSGGGNDYGAAPPKTTDDILEEDELPDDEPAEADVVPPAKVSPPLQSPRR